MSLAIGFFAGRSSPPPAPPPPPPPEGWAPDQLAGVTLRLWLDAQAEVSIAQSGGLVSQWNDRRGNGLSASAAGSQRPAWSASALGDLPGVIFDGADDRLDIASVASFPTGTAAATLVAVARLGATGFYPQLINYGKAAPGKTRGLASAGGAGEVGVTWYSDDYNSGIGWTGLTRIVVGEFVGSAAKLNVDGAGTVTLSASGTPAIDASGNSGQIGAAFGAGPGNYVAHELLVLSGALALGEREKLEGYLAHKWGLAGSLPAGHSYKDAPPN